MAKPVFVLFLLISCVTVYAQGKRTISLLGSFQATDQQALAIGYESRFNTVWPKLNFDSQTQAALRGYWFLADFDDGNIFGIRSTIYWSIEHVGLGVSSRILFQNQLNRLDVGPAVKIGYKFIWLEYSWDFLSDNNVFKDEDLPVIGFKNQEHNVNLTLSIPIVKRKE